jgi:hypothetical protein
VGCIRDIEPIYEVIDELADNDGGHADDKQSVFVDVSLSNDSLQERISTESIPCASPMSPAAPLTPPVTPQFSVSAAARRRQSGVSNSSFVRNRRASARRGRRQSCVEVDIISSATGEAHRWAPVQEITIPQLTVQDAEAILLRYEQGPGTFLFRQQPCALDDSKNGIVVLTMWDGTRVHHFDIRDCDMPMVVIDF